jgi:hypothetical protein
MFFLDVKVCVNGIQRAGIADGGKFYIRQPELLPDFLIKLNIKN